MTKLCPVCAHTLEPYGTGGMVCGIGHHFTVAALENRAPVVAVVAGRTVSVRPWLPGVLLGGVAVVAEIVRSVA